MATEGESRGVSFSRASVDFSSGARCTRRRSTFRGMARSVLEILTLHRGNKPDQTSALPKRAHENTFRMKPVEGHGFSVNVVERQVKRILEDHLADRK